MTATPTIVLEGYSFLESPRWHVDDDGVGRIWVSDFYTHRVVSARADGSDVRIEAEVPGQPSGLGWLPDGRLLVVSMKERRVLRRERDGSLVEHADLSTYAAGPTNDMLVDTHGRAWVGNFGFDLMNLAPIATADLLCVDPDGTVTVAARDLHFPNGMALTAGGDLLVGETIGNRVSAFAVSENGTLGPRRDWATFGPLPDGTDLAAGLAQIVVASDGCALAADGTLWVADALGQRVVRVAAGVGVIEEMAFDTGVFACGFGGDDGNILFVCAAPDFNEHARTGERAARLLAVSVGSS